MYLKCLEVQGFKSFANKIVFEFHNGITGIVGPNGSGKSNVADAVRWVLGEQSAKQLRGASMQDVIFAGTENRKPLSYAYVAITLDNSDHTLPLAYEEVTVARRVYRSGESEYLINGVTSRLKEVSELFYDTGIGKEGYSIIGQGQIDRILSGKPEERRELFDEAAGIVKYKKRKAATQKKLESEKENLIRVNDILSELERQVTPLQKQAEKAKVYLKKKETLKDYDINLFLMEMQHISCQQTEVSGKYKIAEDEFRDMSEQFEETKQAYEKMETSMATMDAEIEQLREELSQSTLENEKQQSQIRVLEEQIHAAEMTDEHLQSRLDAIDQEVLERRKSEEDYQQRREHFDEELSEIQKKKDAASQKVSAIQEKMDTFETQKAEGQKEVIALLNQKIELESNQQRFGTMIEQINIRRSKLNQQLLERKTKEEGLDEICQEHQKQYDEISDKIQTLKQKGQTLADEARQWKEKKKQNDQRMEEVQTRFHKNQSRLESLKNIAERYDGYGNSIRRVMEQRSKHSGILGVVSDLIQVEKSYETAIETALGGSIQNIVTEDEQTAKKMIAYLKENRYGRATFLPLSSIQGRSNPKAEAVLGEPGVVGLASQLVKYEQKYEGIAKYLLGRFVVAKTIEDALVLAKKNKYSLHIVTLDGEYLNPGGAMTGGAFKNSTNLLARNREIEELEQKVEQEQQQLQECRKRLDEIQTALVLGEDEIEENKEELQKLYIEQNTVRMNLNQCQKQRDEIDQLFKKLKDERTGLDEEIQELKSNKVRIQHELEQAKVREAQIKELSEELTKNIEEFNVQKEQATQELATISVELVGMDQGIGFVTENLNRLQAEIEKFELEKNALIQDAAQAKEGVAAKKQEIEEIRMNIQIRGENNKNLERRLKEKQEEKEQTSAEHKGFFVRREEISQRMTILDKEIFRLSSQKEKLKEMADAHINYMWQEYELTPHTAVELRKEEYQSLNDLKKMIGELKDEIRKLGDVNVNAIEEYKEIAGRYEFLKAQHDDLVEAEKTLTGIIEELDTGMRKQFQEKFAEIKREFNASFRQLFGGGHGELELMEDEDILECGIRIIAQPPGKKLQNMMQMSGGEKALTAIALLFAIQALKPSPFCLLDEIEAALDDSNVSRYANYLKKLTKNTQFIVITHRRGTMNGADRLYGITMQEKGVSTLVSVNLIENE